MLKTEVMGLFGCAGIIVLELTQTKNEYWGGVDAYQELAAKSPWWFVKTRCGVIKIGWRKRVISIDWSDTPIRQIITPDDVTKDETMVHAWGLEKAEQYLKNLSMFMDMSKSDKTQAIIKELVNAINSLLVGIKGKEESFPGHNKAYLDMVAIPRAEEALKKVKSSTSKKEEDDDCHCVVSHSFNCKYHTIPL